MYPQVPIGYSTTMGISGLIDRVTVGPNDVAYIQSHYLYLNIIYIWGDKPWWIRRGIWWRSWEPRVLACRWPRLLPLYPPPYCASTLYSLYPSRRLKKTLFLLLSHLSSLYKINIIHLKIFMLCLYIPKLTWISKNS